jgi:hypothetical protein
MRSVPLLTEDVAPVANSIDPALLKIVVAWPAVALLKNKRLEDVLVIVSCPKSIPLAPAAITVSLDVIEVDPIPTYPAK